ncbi:isoleucine--tRNA ligase [bacterium]|nr:isoleucine--tRNA ligase [bacterium]
MTESTKKDYKDSINLPKTTLEMRANAVQKEPETQKFWEENKIYEKNLAQRDKANKFILHDGPPYLSSGKIHIGHALNKILKDIIIKYKSQKGYYAPYVPGYDAHGLPIENAVVKTIKGGRQALTAGELRKKCREFALENLKGQEADFKRLGVWGNWEEPYLTIAPKFEAEQIRVFGEMFKKGYVQKGLKPVYWCASCETALAEAEVEYQDHTSTSIYVRFKFNSDDQNKVYSLINEKSEKDLFVVIWTTTPWTIPSNLAVCLNARLEYTIFEYKNDRYTVATDLLGTFLKDVAWQESDIKVIGTVKGAELENLNVFHPLYNRESKVILGDHVTLDAGTGCVHTAPGHGLEDWEVCQKYNIETFSPLDSKGIWQASDFFNDTDLVGVPYFKGNEIVIKKLEANNALLAKQDITHSYPHCWRCKHPVIYRATAQWFVKVDMFKEQTLNEIKKVKWIPAAGENRISNMVENRSDWCISRQRAWGVPIPVFYCEDCGEVIVNDETINHVADLFEKESSDAWVNHTTEELMPQNYKCPKCGGIHFRKESDIMDVWFDSGVTHYAVVHKRNEELGDLPVEMYLEGSDQHRGWFQSSLLTSVATTGKAPYKSVLTHGFVLDGEGRKMSKSVGNIVAPQEIIKVYGTDVLRLWAASIDYRNDVKIGDTIIKQLVEIFKKTRNTARFLLGNLYDFDPKTDYVKYEDLKSIDKFALHKLNTLIANVTDAFEEYEFYRYFQYLQNFAAVDLSSFYLDIVKDRLYTSGKKSLSRRACQTVLYEICQALVRILVPVMPHQAEDIWFNTPEAQKDGLESILLSKWPEVRKEWNNTEIETEFSQILKVREIVTKAIEPLRADKKIGSSLETAVYIITDKAELLKSYEKELCNIFITSQAFVVNSQPEDVMNTYEEDGYKVYVTKALGEKCERCWKYRQLGQHAGHETICDECFEAVTE